MPYENNHYVPQLVLRRFSERPCVYNIQTGKYKKAGKTQHIFADKNIYTTEIEKRLGQEIETPFADILTKKILKVPVGGELTLTRKELKIIRKFLLAEQMRIESVPEDIEKIKNLKQNNSQLFKEIYPYPEKTIPGETIEEYWLRCLQVLIECKDLEHIGEHELCTSYLYYWAQIYKNGYLAIWDSSKDGTEFLISDIGMTSEREESVLKLGFQMEKKECLRKLAEKNKENTYGPIYADLYHKQFQFHENFYMFSISKTRMLAILNPFFRLYSKREHLETPTIWPSKLQDKKLFEKNKSPKLQVAFGKPMYQNSDKFTYTVYSMRHEDILWVNAYMLDRIEKLVGFSSLEGVKESIEFYINYYKDYGMPAPNNYEPLLKIIEKQEKRQTKNQ